MAKNSKFSVTEKRGYLTAALLMVLTIVLLAGLLFYYGNHRFFGVSSASEDKIAKKIAGLPEISGNENRIFLDGIKLPHDKTSGTFYISQNMKNFGYDGVLSAESGELVWDSTIASKLKQDLISEGDVAGLYFISEDGYEKFDVVITGLPVIEAKMPSGDMQLLYADHNGLHRNQAEASLEIRGSRSRLYEKKSYNLKLEDGKQTFLNLRNDEDWILNALYDDMGLVHNALSYRVWNEMATLNSIQADNTAEQRFVEVLLNGEYAGVYALTERVDKKQLSLGQGDVLYKVQDWVKKSGKDAMKLVYPDKPNAESEMIRDFFISRFCSDEEVSPEERRSLLEYENAIDFALFCQLTVGGDNLLKNSFLVATLRDDGSRPIVEIPWDCNNTWGIWELAFQNQEFIEEEACFSSVADVLIADDEDKVLNDLAERWFVLRKSVFSEENIIGILDENFNELHNSGAYRRNYEKWPNYHPGEGEKIKPSCVDPALVTEFGVKVSDIWQDEYIYDYAKGRLNFLDEWFESKKQAE